MKKALLMLVVVGLVLAGPIYSQSEDELNQQVADLQKKVTQLQQQAQTLGDQIAYFDSQIQLETLKISQSELLINSLANKVVALEGKLLQRSTALEEQIRQTYKQGEVSPMELMFSANNFSEVISRYKYLQVVQENSRKFLHDTQVVQSSYVSQKSLIEDSKKRLEAQKMTLATVRADRDLLLKQTKNDETTYQKLLAEAIAERDAFRAFAHTSGGKLLPPQPSPDGWYFNQRDERWGGQCIGTTCDKNPSYVWEVGCLITSVAMVQKKNGADIDPGRLARESDFFFEDLMLLPWPAQPGWHFTQYGASLNVIESELAAGRPVVVQVRAANNSGGRHFIVIKGKSGSDYIMNDPWEGPDLVFGNYYSRGSIVSVAAYTQGL